MRKNIHHDMTQSRFTLWFRDKRLERAYRASHTRRTLMLVRLALMLGAIIYALFSILDYIVLQEEQLEAIAIRFAFAVPAFLIGLALSFTDYFRERLQFLVAALAVVAGLGVAVISVLYQESMSDLYLAGTLIPVFWAFMFSGLRFIAIVTTCVLLVASYEITLIFFSDYSTETLISYNFFLITLSLVGVIGGYTIERYARRDFIQSRIIDEKRRENERLLHNILPSSIAAKLKQNPGTIAERHEDVTVIFADIVNFSSLARNQSAAETVSILGALFTHFDSLCDEFGLEKIKTIGDCYMVAGGLDEEPGNAHPVLRAVEFSLAMLRHLKEFNTTEGLKISMRVGIHNGPVIAGVIGTKKFYFDIWGDTVNIANRMESTGIPGCIQLSAHSYEVVRHDYFCEKRSSVEVKGFGHMSTYILRPPSTPLKNTIGLVSTTKQALQNGLPELTVQ
ncbi:MAG: hypothetical protein OEZ43_01310 [Gammaproteobacteria bacterium]|nr:hypothetical protein [Gammaproteobacteria bacterium]